MPTVDKQKLIDEGYQPGNNIVESVYILHDGTLWDGGFDLGSRGVEHREVEVFTNYNRYHGKDFWNEVFLDKKMVMVVPESKEILIHPKQELSDQQREQMVNGLEQGFKWEVFK